MKLILLGIYTIVIAGVWGFFIVAKMHAYKFKNFSNYIAPFTNFLFVALGILTIIGYALVFNYNEKHVSGGSNTHSSGGSSSIDY